MILCPTYNTLVSCTHSLLSVHLRISIIYYCGCYIWLQCTCLRHPVYYYDIMSHLQRPCVMYPPSELGSPAHLHNLQLWLLHHFCLFLCALDECMEIVGGKSMPENWRENAPMLCLYHAMYTPRKR
jgi:hypothetical protein